MNQMALQVLEVSKISFVWSEKEKKSKIGSFVNWWSQHVVVGLKKVSLKLLDRPIAVPI